MTIASGIRKILVTKKQTALGSVASGSGGQIIRRRTSVFSAVRDTFESDEIVSHQQSTGVGLGMKHTTGKIEALLSAGTYSLFWATLLRKDFVAGATTGALTNVTAAIGPATFTRAAGSFLTDGFKQFDVVRWTGWATTGTANNSRNFWITSLTATVMTGIFLDGTTGGAKASGDSVTCTVVGKKTLAPLTGHTNDYFTFEEYYQDLARSEVFADCKLNQAAVNLPATGNGQCTFDWMGLSRVLSGSQNFTSPTAETGTGIMTAVNGALYVNGAAVTNVTGLQFTAVDNVTLDGPVVGSNSAPDLAVGRIKITGQFTAYFDANTLPALFDAGSRISLASVLTADQTATSDFLAFSLPTIKLTGDAPDDGEKAIVRTYPFTAEINTAGGAALALDQTILSIQDSAAA
jgi:hypothetical protein